MRRAYNQVWAKLQNVRWQNVFPQGIGSASRASEEKKPLRGKYFHLPSNQCAICAWKASSGILALSATTADTFGYLNTPTIPMGVSELDDQKANGSGPPTYPITTPYTTSCGHVYCYICLADQLIRAIDDGYDGWECLRCNELIVGCERVEAERGTETTSESWASDIEDDLSSSFTSE